MACDRCGCEWASVLQSFGGWVLFCPSCGKTELMEVAQDSVLEQDLFDSKGEGDDPEKS